MDKILRQEMRGLVETTIRSSDFSVKLAGPPDKTSKGWIVRALVSGDRSAMETALDMTGEDLPKQNSIILNAAIKAYPTLLRALADSILGKFIHWYERTPAWHELQVEPEYDWSKYMGVGAKVHAVTDDTVVLDCQILVLVN